MGIPKHCVLVDEALWRWYLKRRHELSRDWREVRWSAESWTEPGQPDLEVASLCMRAGLAELREQVRKLSEQFPGNYLVPV